MMKSIIIQIIIALFAIIMFFSLRLNAQAPLSNALVDSTVVKLGNLMIDYYIIKEKGVEANKMLNSNLKRKKYYSLDGGVLANTLIEDLQVITNDKHLMIKFYPDGDAATVDLAQDKSENDEYIPNELSLKRARIHNYGFKEVAILNLNIGYLKLDGFYDIRNPETTEAAAAAMEFLTHSNGMIIDLSENSGGDAATLQFLMSYFFPVDPPTHYNTFHFRDGKDHYIEERTLPYVPGNRKSKTPLYVIVSENTFSAGEAMAYALKQLKRAIIIGQTTGGGAHAANFKLINDYFDMSIPMARAINPITNSNWEGLGVKPDVEIEISKAKDYAQAELIKMAMEQESDEILLARYNWQLDELQWNLNGFPCDEKSLSKYLGDFDGNRRIYIEDHKLKYQRGEGQVSTLTAMSEDTFISDRFSDFRFKFEFDGDTLIGLKLYNEFGQFSLVEKVKP